MADEKNRAKPVTLDIGGAMDPADRSLLSTLGSQATVWAFGCDPGPSDDPDMIAVAMQEFCEAGGLTVFTTSKTKYEPQGVTVVLVLKESHMLVNTWPEHGVAQVELFSCKGLDIDGLGKMAKKVFRAEKIYTYRIG